jgi:recombination protein RecA
LATKKKADNSASARRLLIEEIAASVNNAMNGQLLIKGSEARQDVPHLSTGILSYDLALGGGWAANQWNEIVGEESSGKTALAYKTIAANQAQDPEFLALWVAAEEYVPEYAQSFGVDLERLWVVETNEMEKALELVLKAVQNRAVDCVVIDSLPALVTNTETDKAMDEASVATGAQILSRFFKKCTSAQRRSMLAGEEDRPCTLIAINQWRDKIGVMFGDPRTTPGGKAKNYYFFTRVEVRRDDWIAEVKSNLDSRVGQVIKMRVFKNKTFRPQQVAQVDFFFADSPILGMKMGDFDTVKDTVNVCLALDVFEGRYKFNGEKIASNKEELYDRVREDLGLQRDLTKAAHMAMFDRSASLSTTVVTESTNEPSLDEVAEDFAEVLDIEPVEEDE